MLQEIHGFCILRIIFQPKSHNLELSLGAKVKNVRKKKQIIFRDKILFNESRPKWDLTPENGRFKYTLLFCTETKKIHQQVDKWQATFLLPTAFLVYVFITTTYLHLQNNLLTFVYTCHETIAFLITCWQIFQHSMQSNLIFLRYPFRGVRLYLVYLRSHRLNFRPNNNNLALLNSLFDQK